MASWPVAQNNARLGVRRLAARSLTAARREPRPPRRGSALGRSDDLIRGGAALVLLALLCHGVRARDGLLPAVAVLGDDRSNAVARHVSGVRPESAAFDSRAGYCSAHPAVHEVPL